MNASGYNDLKQVVDVWKCRSGGFDLLALLQKYRPEIKSASLRKTELGKPYLADRSLSFNLTHSGGLTFVAVSRDRELGIDLQSMETRVEMDSLVRDLWTDSEKVEFSKMRVDEKRESFFRIWVQKEAIAKLTGRGLQALSDPIPSGVLTTEIACPDGYKSCLAVSGDKFEINEVVRL